MRENLAQPNTLGNTGHMPFAPVCRKHGRRGKGGRNFGACEECHRAFEMMHYASILGGAILGFLFGLLEWSNPILVLLSAVLGGCAGWWVGALLLEILFYKDP
jgi:hypothetical protein